MPHPDRFFQTLVSDFSGFFGTSGGGGGRMCAAGGILWDMPTNVSPEYKRAEAEYKAAREPRDRLACLKEMLRAIPKHKGTEHLQAGIKTKIKELTEELTGPRKGGARGGPALTIRPEGAGQVALLGPPNSGKSALHHALTGSGAAVGPYPFTTQIPQPGMAPVEDVGIQLVDLPPIARQRPIPWIGNALGPADGGLLVVDLSHPGCAAGVAELLEGLEERKVRLVGEWPRGAEGPSDPDDPFAKLLPAAWLAARSQATDWEEELDALEELVGLRLPKLSASVEEGRIGHIGPWLFKELGVVRVYTESAAKKRDDRPYTIRRGQTVGEVAAMIHKDLARDLKFARLIRDGTPHRRIGRGFALSDGDRIEIHT